MRKIDRFTASYKHVDVQKLSRVFTMYVCVMYMSCSTCAKTLLSFCVYEQRLCHVFAVYVIAMHVHWFDNAKNQSIYCIIQACKCVKAELCLYNVYVCDVYELQYMCKDCVMSLQCMWLQCMYIDLIKRKIDWFTALCRRVNVQKLNHVFAIYVCMLYMSSTCE